MNNKKELWHATRIKNLKKQRDSRDAEIRALHQYINKLLMDMPFYIEQSIARQVGNEINRKIILGN